MEAFQQFKEAIEQANRIIITSHVNPDGDAIGSELALYYTLKKLNKEVNVINHSATPYTLIFLDPNKIIEQYDKEKHDEVILKADVIVFLDLNVANRVASMQEIIEKFDGEKWVIDHQTDKEDFADHYIIDTNACATGEIIYNLITEEKLVKIDRSIALPLYTAIMTDTGSFRFDRTTPQIHRIVAELMEFGIQPDFVYEQVYDQGEIGRLKLLGFALETLTLNSTGEICYMTITRKALEETSTNEEDIEGFVNYTMSVRGVKIGMLFFETEEGFKISFRSKGKIPVNKIAAEFGGGGHLNASGARIKGKKLEDYFQKVVQTAEKYLKEGEENAL